MYSKLYACVKRGEYTSDYFKCTKGTKQGCHISPAAFQIYVNDLPKIFSMEKCEPLSVGDMKIGCLLYADDVLILSQGCKGLQESLNNLNRYCQTWRLNVSIRKTKVMVFNSRKNKYVFKLGNKILQNADQVSYLGFILTPSGSFKATLKYLYTKANRALFSLRSSLGSLPSIPVKTYIRLFDTMIKPILMYGSEVWGAYMFEPNTSAYYIVTMLKDVNILMEKLHSKICKQILMVNRKASNYAVRYELGRYPFIVDIICSVFKYYVNIVNRNGESLAKVAASLHKSQQLQWFNFIQYIAAVTGCNVNDLNIRSILKGNSSVYNKLKVLSEKVIFKQVSKSNKLQVLTSVKTVYGIEPYLYNLQNPSDRKAVTKYRISAHKLPVESGRYLNIDRQERYCKFCHVYVGDENHCLLRCFHPALTMLRKTFLNDIYRINPQVKSLPRDCLFVYLLSFKDKSIMHNTAKYISDILELHEMEN